MVSKKATGRGKIADQDAEAQKETLKDLDVRGKALKGGMAVGTPGGPLDTRNHRADCGGVNL